MAGATLEGAVSGPLAPALAVSIALHAAVLAGLPELWTSSDPPTPSPLTAWLVPGLQSAGTAEPAPAATPERAAEAAPQRRSAAAAKPAPSVSKAAPAREPEGPAPLNAPAVQELAPAERTSVAASAAVPGSKNVPLSAPVAAPAESGGEGSPDVGSLAQYRLALISAAKEHKTYPPRAIDRGLEGRVDVRVAVGADGAPARVLVQRSSRHDVLDREALELLRKAAALTPVPPALRNRDFAVEVPVLYELKDAR